MAPFGPTSVSAPSCGLCPGHGLTFGMLEKQKRNCFVSLLPDSSPPDGWLRHGFSFSWSMMSSQALSTFLFLSLLSVDAGVETYAVDPGPESDSPRNVSYPFQSQTSTS